MSAVNREDTVDYSGDCLMAKKSKKVIVVGTNHGKQEVSEKPTLFERKLRNYVERAHVSVIIEEWKFDDDKTIGKRIADSLSIAWCNAGPPMQEQFKTYEPCPLWLDASCVTELRYGPIEAQIKREAYMIDRICSAMTDHAVGLFVCGMAHMHSISEKLHSAGYDVDGYDCLDDKCLNSSFCSSQ
jgi:hypothetical protein